MPAVQSKGWCFTLNNYTESQLGYYHNPIGWDKWSDIEYLVVGREVGESGTPHLQGYIRFKKKVTFPTVLNVLRGHPHIEKAKGSPKQNRTYCTKGGDFKEFGVVPKQGKRADLVEAVELFKKTTKSVDEWCTEFPQYLQHAHLLDRVARVRHGHRTEAPKLYALWGPPGVGKSHRAREIAKGYETMAWVTFENGFLGGYNGEECAIFDDFRGDSMKMNVLLRLTDKYPYMVNVKGGYTRWTAKCVIFTCVDKPEHWYKNSHLEDPEQLLRRFRAFGSVERVRRPPPPPEEGEGEEEEEAEVVEATAPLTPAPSVQAAQPPIQWEIPSGSDSEEF